MLKRTEVQHVAAEKTQLRSTAAATALVSLLLCVLGLVLSAYWKHWPAPLPQFDVNGVALDNGTLLLTTPERAVVHDHAGLIRYDFSLRDLNLSEIRGKPALLSTDRFALAGSRWIDTPHNTQELIEGTFLCQTEPVECRFIESLKVFPKALDLFFEPSSERLYINHGSYLSAYNPDNERSRSTTLALGDETFAMFEGLMYASDPDAPALRVFSIDDRTFMRELDQILFIDPADPDPLTSRVKSFVETQNGWWIVLSKREKDSLHRFSPLGEHLQTIQMEHALAGLVKWRDSVLAIPEHSGAFLKFAGAGTVEASFNNQALLAPRQALEAVHFRERSFLTLSAAILLGILPLGLMIFFTHRWLNELARHDTSSPSQGLLELPPSARWYNPQFHWRRLLSLTGGGAAVCLLAVVIIQHIDLNSLETAAIALVAVSSALSGLYALSSRHGFIGQDGPNLILVNAQGLWEAGRDASIRWHGPYAATRHLITYLGWQCHCLSPRDQMGILKNAKTVGSKISLTALLALLVRAGHPHAKAIIAWLVSVYLSGLLVLASVIADMIRW